MTLDTSSANVDTSRAPEKTHVRLGFVALSDAAPLVAAKLLEFGHAHGLTIELLKQPSWAAIRDKLLSGDLDAAHSLYGLVYGVQLGIGAPQTDMAVLMVLNRNGQAITVSKRLSDAIEVHQSLPAALATLGRKPVFAQTFPTGTHAMWLYYWLAAQGVHPLRDIESVVIPPPQMVDALQQDRLDGLCVGEPWNAVAQDRGVGRTIAYTSEVWADHPEKVLACRRDFVTRYPGTARALVQTMLEACRWLDDDSNREEMARRLAGSEFLGVPVGLIASRLLKSDSGVKFFEDGVVNYPHPSEGVWFLAQYSRWGMMDWRPDFSQISAEVCQTDVYRDAAVNVGVDVHAERHVARFIDGREWDGGADRGYVEGFGIRA